MTALNQALAPAPAQRTWQVVALAAVVVLGLTMASLVGSVLSVGATWPTNIPITVSFLYMTTTSTVRHATSMPPRGSLTLCSQPVRPFVCYQTCEYRILKNEYTDFNANWHKWSTGQVFFFSYACHEP